VVSSLCKRSQGKRWRFVNHVDNKRLVEIAKQHYRLLVGIIVSGTAMPIPPTVSSEGKDDWMCDNRSAKIESAWPSVICPSAIGVACQGGVSCTRRMKAPAAASPPGHRHPNRSVNVQQWQASIQTPCLHASVITCAFTITHTDI
jgi:hypothetical protein